MISYIIGILLSNIAYFALHITNGGGFPRPLSEKEESEAIEQMKNGDRAAREKLIEHNLRLVAHLAKKYYSVSKDTDDLISVGTVGLIKGIDSFNSEKNYRLVTYISRCIENEILMSLRLRKKSSRDVYMNDPLDYDKSGNPLTLVDIIAEDDNIVEKIDSKIKISKLAEYIDMCLSPKEKKIICERYGVFGSPERTQNEIAKDLGISRSYVSRIEKRALKTLFNRYEGH